MMRDDFCIFILTHGRSDNVITLKWLERTGYTGKVYLVVDDEDSHLERYMEAFGESVLVFSKSEVAKTTDEGDNFSNRGSPLFARNACFDLARQVGCKYFMELDDDYTGFYYRFNGDGEYKNKSIKNLDNVLSAMISYFEETPSISSIAMAQGGDYFGGSEGRNALSIRTMRKCMNSFLCSTDRPFKFIGKMNDDVNTYTFLGHIGKLFFTINQISLFQEPTQQNKGGITELYLSFGTYVKSFYTVMLCPSCTKITSMGGKHMRIHHAISWNNAVPLIIDEKHKKPCLENV